jgi:hypothetical protein
MGRQHHHHLEAGRNAKSGTNSALLNQKPHFLLVAVLGLRSCILTRIPNIAQKILEKRKVKN